MHANVGTIDRALRVVAGLVLVGLTLAGIIGPWGWLGLIAIATGVLRFCPAYALTGFKTCAISTESPAKPD